MDEMEKKLGKKVGFRVIPNWEIRTDDEKGFVAHVDQFHARLWAECLRLMAEQEWIKVEERLPEIGQVVEVLVTAEQNVWLSWALRYVSEEGDGWLWSFVTDDHICLHHPEWVNSQDEDWKPTFWRPLPIPPGREIVPKEGSSK